MQQVFLYRFCVLLLYWIKLLFLTNGVFLMVSLVFSIYIYITSSKTQWQFYFFLSNWMPFIAFSCLAALTRTSNIMLNKNDKHGLPCLVSDLTRRVFSFSHWVRCWLDDKPTSHNVRLWRMDFIMLRYIASVSTLLRVFIINGYWILSSAFFGICWDDHMTFNPSCC